MGVFFGKRQNQTLYILGIAITNAENRQGEGKKKSNCKTKQLTAQYLRLTNKLRFQGQNVQESSEFLIISVLSVFYYVFPLLKINKRTSAFCKCNGRLQSEFTLPCTNKIVCTIAA